MDDIKQIQKIALQQLEEAGSLEVLEQLRIHYLGKNGLVTGQMKVLGSLPEGERKSFGATVNIVKQALLEAIEAKKVTLEGAALQAKLLHETLDVTLPSRSQPEGFIHPISQAIEEVTAIFASMGFSVAEGPNIEDDYHNFTALNIPPHHPARQMQDTFYLPDTPEGNKVVLRTHTSPVQIRTMKSGPPPYRIIAPGRTYRAESDMTHTPMFHQVEGLYIDTAIHMGHLKGCLVEFIQRFFEVDAVPVRFRPSFFPFTEPSAEVDIGCSRVGNELKIGGSNDWLEVLGCGMVHPNVLRNVGIDPNLYQGFAFGLGIERLAMLKYGIADLRTFFDADIRWLKHYGFSAFDIPSLVGGLSR